MNCDKCNVEMIEGSLIQNGTLWSSHKLVSNWAIRLSRNFRVGHVVKAFRCPQCNKIELVAAQI